jgi:uncharacterized protein (TIGR02300 family)
VAKIDLGTKRIDPETGRKFYDLNKDPIVSPYTGIAYPRSAFEVTAKTRAPAAKAVVAEEEVEVEAEKEVEVVSLEEADEEAGATGVVKADGVEDDEIEDDEDDTFLATDDEEEDDVEDIVGDVGDEEV